MKQVFTLVEFEYNREVLPTEIQAAITKLLGAYPVRVEAAQQSVQPTAFGAGGRGQNSLQSSFIADDLSATHGGG